MAGYWNIAKFLIPKIPIALKAAIYHILGWTEQSFKWDLKTEVVMALMRSMMDPEQLPSISTMQSMSTKDPGIVGSIWISKVTLPISNDDGCLPAIRDAFQRLGNGSDEFIAPETLPVEAEWTGFRTGADTKSPRPNLPESEQYDRLMKDVKRPGTILYLHGGAFYMMDPATHRGVCAKLAELTGSRCLSVRYRLAPQHPFPAALLDCLVAYLSLLCPAEGALHEAEPATRIVIASDSAGGSLALALIQVILRLHRAAPAGQTPTIRFQGQDVAVPLPAGIALSSPHTDVTACMPSMDTNVAYDYAPPPTESLLEQIPQCDIWPAEPSRLFPYCDLTIATHPLVSPLAARDWTCAPPAFFSYGTEILADEGKAVARRMAENDVVVETWNWDAMPHCFSQVLVWRKEADIKYEKWASFIRRAVDGAAISTRYTFVKVGTLEMEPISAQQLSPYSAEEVQKKMEQKFEILKTWKVRSR